MSIKRFGQPHAAQVYSGMAQSSVGRNRAGGICAGGTWVRVKRTPKKAQIASFASKGFDEQLGQDFAFQNSYAPGLMDALAMALRTAHHRCIF